MTTPASFNQPPTFAERIAAEEAQVKAGQPGCGHVCPGCHGGLTCIRTTHADTAAHVGRDADGEPVQWVGPCPPLADSSSDFMDGAAR